MSDSFHRPSNLLDWLHDKLSVAEKSVKSRLEMAASCERQCDPKYWEELTKGRGVIIAKGRGKAPTQKELKEQALRHRRIAAWCETDVKVLKELIAMVKKQDQ